MSKISLEYNGELRNSLIHLESKTEILTDAPTDNNGKGESFSPTDLVAASLAACMVTVINISDRDGVFGIKICSAEVEKIMQRTPRRISEIVVALKIKTIVELSPQKKKNIYDIAKNCPVALSLSNQTNQNISITFDH
ncbi:MAG: OsmC family protein [Flavobacteriales bacterium]